MCIICIVCPRSLCLRCSCCSFNAAGDKKMHWESKSTEPRKKIVLKSDERWMESCMCCHFLFLCCVVWPLALHPTVVPHSCESQPVAAQQQTGWRTLEKRDPDTHGWPSSHMGKYSNSISVMNNTNTCYLNVMYSVCLCVCRTHVDPFYIHGFVSCWFLFINI